MIPLSYGMRRERSGTAGRFVSTDLRGASADPGPRSARVRSNHNRSNAMSRPAHSHLSPDAIYPFDARGIAKRFRHAAIFGALDALQSGETMRFTNDHDPLPLLDQLTARYGDSVTIRYVQRDPGAILIDFVKS
jgi:uncharacterized protein (DUF2249 family)